MTLLILAEEECVVFSLLAVFASLKLVYEKREGTWGSRRNYYLKLAETDLMLSVLPEVLPNLMASSIYILYIRGIAAVSKQLICSPNNMLVSNNSKDGGSKWEWQTLKRYWQVWTAS